MAFISPMHPTWNRSSRFSPRLENFCTTLSTRRRLPEISFSLACLSPCLHRRSSSAFSCSLSTGSLAVLTPQISTLLLYTHPLPICFSDSSLGWFAGNYACKNMGGFGAAHRKSGERKNPFPAEMGFTLMQSGRWRRRCSKNRAHPPEQRRPAARCGIFRSLHRTV